MKKIYSLFGLFLLIAQLQAKQIDLNTALSVGKNFLNSQTNSQTLQKVSNLNLVYKAKSNISSSITTAQETTSYYVLNNANNGFIVVAGDDNASPILGYSNNGAFDLNNIPPNLAKWLEGYKSQIRFIVENNIAATTEITNQWTALKNNTYQSPLKIKGSIATSVSPLVQTKWGQSPYENELCPYDINAGSENGYHSVAGCPATAMAQIMKFWNYPTTGSGFHSYNHSTYGTLSANFGSTTFNWAAMPNVISSSNNAIATLMYFCGVSVEMQYGPKSSGSYVIMDGYPTEQTSENAYKTYFGYNAITIKGLWRKNYSDDEWKTILKDELNAGRPVQYAGFNTGSGHTFVCDGYDVNGKFHMNWGWSGQNDGFWLLDALNPGTSGTGSGTGTYNLSQQAIIGIQPPSYIVPTKISMFSNITVNPDPIIYNQSVTVNADIKNIGTTTFNGDITAALFDANYNFVQFIQTIALTNGLLPNYHYTSGINFTSSKLNATPGNYYIGIFVKPTGGNWLQVSNGSFLNMKPITIVTNSSLKMYSGITVLPSSLIQNQPATIKVDVANFGTTFTGKVSVDLHNIDGTWIQQIDEKSGLSMATNTHFSNGLTFNSSGLNVKPGSYQIAVWAQGDGGVWALVEATTSYVNPKSINIVEPPLQSDLYEPNDNPSTAYNLIPSFIGDSARVSTESSNIHLGTDQDYYKVVLPEKYNYTITARLHDIFSNSNGKAYTVDASFAYYVNNWSESYDDVMSKPISITGGGNVYFVVSPYFTGQTGTYLFDLTIKRSSSTNVIITQVYGGGGNSGSVYKSDFIELYNTSNTDVDISGWTLYYLGATSSSTSIKYDFPSNTIIKAGKYFALKCADGTGTQPAWSIVFDGTSTLALGGTAGKVILLRSNAAFTLSSTPTIEEIINNVNFADYVPYGTTALPIWGSAMSSSTTSTTAAKRKFVNGRYQYSKNIGNDFEIVTAEPRNSSTITSTTTVNNSHITLFAYDKTVFIKGAISNESIEIYNITGLKVYSSKVVSNTIQLKNLSTGIYIVKIGARTFKIKL